MFLWSGTAWYKSIVHNLANFQGSNLTLKKRALENINMKPFGKICWYDIDILAGTTENAVQFPATINL